VLVVAPFYHRPRPEGLLEYYKAVVQASPVPIMVYNIPARQGYSIAADVVIRLVESYPDRVLGMKESSWDVVQLSRLRGRLGEDFRLFTGTGNLALAAAALGLAGVISLAANVLPGEVARQWSLCQKGRWEEARALHLRLTDLNEILTEDSPMMVKVALELMGILSAEPRLPMTRPHPADVERLRQALEQAGILPLVDRAAGS
jgi:4-hydroxy-tetrahydrodipicolinate synthase